MTTNRLEVALTKIEEYYGRKSSDEERKTRAEVFAYALRDIPDEVAMPALMRALTVCRYPSQLLVDWCSEIKAAGVQLGPSEGDLWQQARKAAWQIDQESYWAQIGGITTAAGKLTPTYLRDHVKQVFKALPPAVQEWAGSPQELVAQMNRPLAEITQYVRPSFVKAVKAAQPQALAMQPAAPQLEPPRVDRPEPSGNDFLADAVERPRRHKRKE